MLISPKMSVSPLAKRKSSMPNEIPFRVWIISIFIHNPSKIDLYSDLIP